MRGDRNRHRGGGDAPESAHPQNAREVVTRLGERRPARNLDGPILVGLLVAGFALGKLQTAARSVGRVDAVGTVVQAMVNPIARPLASATDSTGEFLYGLFRARRLTQENLALRDRLGALALYEERIDDLDSQMAQLRRLSGLPPLAGRERVSTEVVNFSPYDNRITLGVGEERGIQRDMPVINGDGLVGLVQTVGRGQCQAVLLTYPDRQIGGIDISRKPPPFGFVKGRDNATLVMTFFDPNASVRSGDTIVTSGLSTRIPRGLIVGRVIEVVDDPDYGARRATVDPAVNLGSLREVQILK